VRTKQGEGKIKYKVVDRWQMSWRILDIERLIPSDHPARIIWEIAGKMHLDAFVKSSKTREGKARQGAPAGRRNCWSACGYTAIR
jgi:hypothetical protein